MRAGLVLSFLLTSEVAVHAQSIVTVAGGGTDDGLPANQVGLYGVTGLAIDGAGNIYLSESSANLIRRIDTDGSIHTLAGTGGGGFAGDGNSALRATLKTPLGIAVDASGNVYFADSANDKVRKIDAATGIIRTIAGGGADRPDHTIDGAADGSVLKGPTGLWLDGNDLYVTERNYDGNRIRRIDLSAKTIETIAGALDGTAGYSGDGQLAVNALLAGPIAVAVDASKNIYVADNANNVVRRIDGTTKKIETYAGGGTLRDGEGDGKLATSVLFEYLGALALDANNNLLITQQGRVRRVDRNTQKISTVATGISVSYGLVVTKTGDLVLSNDDGTVRRVASGSLDPVVIAGGGNYVGDGLLATAAVLRSPTGLAVAPDGTLYIADSVNAVVRRVDPNGIISTYAGITGHFYQDGGEGEPATSVAIGGVADVALDADGNLYLADPHNSRIKRVDAKTQRIRTVAGGGDPAGGSNEGLAATSAKLVSPRGVFVDKAGNLFIADTDVSRIWKVDATTQTIRTFAGNGISGFSGDGAAATAASLAEPTRAVVDSKGNVIIADSGNGALRKVTPDGRISTILRGLGSTAPNLGDGGSAADAFAEPAHIAIDPRNDDIYIADRGTMRVRKIDAAGKISTIAGSGTAYYDTDFSGDDGRATDAKLNFPFALSGVAVDRSGNVFFSDAGNNRVRAVFACTTVGAPVLSGPAAGAQTSTAPTLAWAKVPGAFRYEVRLDVVSPPGRVVASDLDETSFTPANLAPGTKYFWQVTAKGDPFCPSQSKTPSVIASFTTAAGCGVASFNLLSPAPGAQNTGDSTGTLLSWEPATGAGSYDVYVGRSSPPPLASTVSGTSYKTSISGQVYWFVVAHAACDTTKTATTSIRSFSTSSGPVCLTLIPVVAISSPQPGATNVATSVDLVWTANVDFESFDVYFGNVASPSLLRSQLGGSVRSITLPLLTAGATYYWRVVGKSPCNPSGETSTAVVSFTTRSSCLAPGAPAFQFVPQAAAVGSTYAVVWSPAAGLDAEGGYLVERSTTSDFSSGVETQLTTSAAAAFIASSTGTFYHRVRGVPSCDSTLAGPPSETRSVVVSAAPPNVIFTLQPRAVVSPLGDRIEDHPTTFALENLSPSRVQVFIGQQELNGSPPFFRIAEDAAFVTLEPRTPRTFTIRFSGPPSNVERSYQAVIFVASTGTGLAVTPYTFVNLKVGGGPSVAPEFLVDGLPTDYAAFIGFSGDDSLRDPLKVTIRNPGTTSMDLAAEIGPEAWLIPESGWNAPLAAGTSRTVKLFTRRTLAPNGSALPRYTYFTVRTKDGASTRLLVQDNDGIAVNAGRATSLAVNARSFIVPEVVSATSPGGHRIVTRMRLTNLGSDSVQAELIYTPSGSDGFDASSVQRVVVVVPANDVITITDPAFQLFGRPAPQAGQIEVRLPRERVGLVSVRASEVVLGGAGGLETPVVNAGDGARNGTAHVVTLLPQSNVSLVLAETSGADLANVKLTTYDASGAVTSTKTQLIARYGMVRVSGLVASRIGIEVQSGGGSVIGVATLATAGGESGVTVLSRPVEERTGSAALARAMWKGTLEVNPSVSVTTVVPVLSAATSAGSAPAYSTALGFVAPASIAATFSATFHSSSGFGPVPKVEVTVPAGGSRLFADASKELFGNASGTQGSIFVSAPGVAKVYAVLQGGSNTGAASTPMTSLPLQTTLSDAISGASSSAQKPLSFDGLEQSQDAKRGTRWLLVLNEVGGGGGSVVVRLYEAGNRNAAIAQKEVAISPYQQLRLDTVFSELGLDAADRRKDRINVQVIVSATKGSARVTASAMSIDNVSGDTHVFALLPAIGTGSPNVSTVAPVTTPPKPPDPTRRRPVRH